MNPFSTEIHQNYATVAMYARRYDDAIVHGNKALELESTNVFAKISLGQAYIRSGKADKAFALWTGPRYEGSALLAWGYAFTGRRQDAIKIVQELTKVGGGRTAFTLAMAYFELGDKARGFEWLNKSVDRHEPQLKWLNVTQFGDNEAVHNDSRFKAILARMKFPAA